MELLLKLRQNSCRGIFSFFAQRTGNGRDIDRNLEEVQALCVSTLLRKYQNYLFFPPKFTSIATYRGGAGGAGGGGGGASPHLPAHLGVQH